MFKAFDFCLPTNATKVPAGPERLHEIKHDGFRIRVERDGDRMRLITRGGYDWTKPRRTGFETSRPPLSERPVKALDQGEEPNHQAFDRVQEAHR